MGLTSSRIAKHCSTYQALPFSKYILKLKANGFFMVEGEEGRERVKKREGDGKNEEVDSFFLSGAIFTLQQTFMFKRIA